MGKLKGKKEIMKFLSHQSKDEICSMLHLFIYIYIYILPQVNNLISKNDKDKSILTQVQNRPMHPSPE